MQATAAGSIVDPRQGNRLASFEQRYRLWTGRPILEIRDHAERARPELARACGAVRSLVGVPGMPMGLARRQLDAPPDGALDPRDDREPTGPETPDALDITTRTQRTAILFGGLPYHRKHGGRMLDTLLVAGAETCRSFALGVVLDLEHPFHAAQDFVTPPAVVAIDDGPPAMGVAGWLARIDHQNVAISRVEFAENAGERGWGLVFHLLETAGQSGRCRLRLFRNPTLGPAGRLPGRDDRRPLGRRRCRAGRPDAARARAHRGDAGVARCRSAAGRRFALELELCNPRNRSFPPLTLLPESVPTRHDDGDQPPRPGQHGTRRLRGRPEPSTATVTPTSSSER